MKALACLSTLALAGWLALPTPALAQSRPYLGYVYPAGGRQGTTFPVKVGGQALDEVTDVLVSGSGVTARAVHCFKRIGPQEMTLLRDQLRELRADKAAPDPAHADLIARLERRIAEYCQRPASSALAGLVFLEFSIAPEAPPGQRTVRLRTTGGVSNPMVFLVGQFPESTRKPMLTAEFQVLGKEHLALRQRPAEEGEVRIAIPCTLNGQVASGEINRYRFTARKGQRLVVSVLARQLIPFIADAVPGWFQPVLTLYDGRGREIAYQDDFRFKPDPVILFEVPADGEYVAAITDAIHRGREDFVYRMTLGESPHLTSVFPLGGRAGEEPRVRIQGWNLQGAVVTAPSKAAGPGIHAVRASVNGVVSNAAPFALDTLPESLDREPNDASGAAQKVSLPVIVNGRIDRVGDWDVFEFLGKAGDTVVAEAVARRLDSPMDPVLKITGTGGSLLACNDDHEDPGGGVNTHHADSNLSVKLPGDGVYQVHIGDTVRAGGEEYGYRLRLSPARPDFALRVVPSSLSLRAKSGGFVTVYAARQDGFAGAIRVELRNPPPGISCQPVTIAAGQQVARIPLKTDLTETRAPLDLVFTGRSVPGPGQAVIERDAIPCEDRMQAFLWRHLVPAPDFKVVVLDPAKKPAPRRVMPPASPQDVAEARKKAEGSPAKFTKNQVAGRLRQIESLYEEGLLTDAFASKRVAECTAQE